MSHSFILEANTYKWIEWFLCNVLVLQATVVQHVRCFDCNLLHNISADGLQKLKEEWLNGDEATRKFLEKKYGKATIQLAVEESFTNEWLKNYAKKCPGCGANIQVSNNKI